MRGFTGRDGAVDAIAEALTAPGEALRCSVVAGPGGVGKTALATRVGHRVRDQFPDGQLFAVLRGVEQNPADPAEVLDDFLVALGVAAPFLPAMLEKRMRLFRSRLADRRVLIVLDDAATADQVRPLLPGEAGCAVLVTSRTPLVGLEGARLHPLDVLDDPAALALLAELLGRERVEREPAAAADIVRWCGGLPLALWIAGARVAAAPHWDLTGFAELLAVERDRLDELVAGDLGVRASIERSYRRCNEAERRALCLLGELRVGPVALWAVAALLGVDLQCARRSIERLVAAHLVTVAARDEAGQLRYALHDLVRLYARERLADELPDAWPAARARLTAACVSMTSRAERVAHPYDVPGRAAPPE